MTIKAVGNWTESLKRTNMEIKVLLLLDLQMVLMLLSLLDSEQYEISSSDEDLPFACYICREHFRNPIVTK